MPVGIHHGCALEEGQPRRLSIKMAVTMHQEARMTMLDKFTVAGEAGMAGIRQVIAAQWRRMGYDHVDVCEPVSRAPHPRTHLALGVLHRVAIVLPASLEAHHGNAVHAPAAPVQVEEARIRCGVVIAVVIPSHVQDWAPEVGAQEVEVLRRKIAT